jgi:hypothetical protein
MICRECEHHSFGISLLDVKSAKSQRRGRIAADRFHNEVLQGNPGQLFSRDCEVIGSDRYQRSFRTHDRLNSGYGVLEQGTGAEQRDEGLGKLGCTERPESLPSSACHDYRM